MKTYRIMGVILLILLAGFVFSQEEVAKEVINEDLNSPKIVYDSVFVLFPQLKKIENDFINITYEQKNLLVYIPSIENLNNFVNKPDTIFISINDSNPKITLIKNLTELLSISLRNKTCNIYFGQYSFEGTNAYIIEDENLVVVTTNNPDLEITNGITFLTAEKKIKTKSFLQQDTNSEINILSNNALLKIFGGAKALFINNFNKLFFSEEYKKGFSEIGKTEYKIDNQTYIEISPLNCSKYGFLFRKNYQNLNLVKQFTKTNGFAMAIAYSEWDDVSATKEISQFIDLAKFLGIEPIVRIQIKKEETPQRIINFINYMQQKGGQFYQIGDKVNDQMTASQYINYVKEIKKGTNAKIISSALNKNNSNYEQYLLYLANSDEFMDSIDFWGSNEIDDLKNAKCIEGEEFVCDKNFFGYKYELTIINKSIEAIIDIPFLEKQIKTRDYMQKLRDDPKVKAIILNEGINETSKKLTETSLFLSKELCEEKI